MYFGSGLHAWDNQSVHSFIKNDFGINEFVALSMQRCRAKNATMTLDVMDRRKKVVFETGENATLTMNNAELSHWLLQFMRERDLLTHAEIKLL